MASLVAFGYLIAAVCFILALRGLSSPASAQQGNRIGIAGMAIAVVVTLFALPEPGWGSYLLIAVGLAAGGTIGAIIARRIQMTAMPQLVAGFHSLVGMAAVWSRRPPCMTPPPMASPDPTAASKA